MLQTNLDLPTTGKLIFETTLGEIDIELWCKECPEITERFLELCESGFYNGSSIFKVFRGQFVVLGKLELGSRGKLESECNSRLKFRHRGMLGLFSDDEYASSIDSQYHVFVTMDKLQDFNRYTLFGKVVNNTIYNLIDIQNVEVDDRFSPKLPIRIVNTVILMNPFLKSKAAGQKAKGLSKPTFCQPPAESGRKKRMNDRNLLSFYQEAVDDSGCSLKAPELHTGHKEQPKRHRGSPESDNSRKSSHEQEVCHHPGGPETDDGDDSSRNCESKRHDEAVRKPGKAKRDEDTLEKLREFSVRLKSSLGPNSEKWYGRKDGLNFGVDSSNAYNHTRYDRSQHQRF